MECQRCNSKLPDNLKFCGFCGLEIETGKERIIESWVTYIGTVLPIFYGKQSEMTTKTIAGCGLIAASTLTLVAQYPFESGYERTLLVLALLGLISGIVLTTLFIQFYVEMGTGQAIYSLAFLMITCGLLTSTEDIFGFLLKSELKMRKRLKISEATWASFLEKLSD